MTRLYYLKIRFDLIIPPLLFSAINSLYQLIDEFMMYSLEDHLDLWFHFVKLTVIASLQVITH